MELLVVINNLLDHKFVWSGDLMVLVEEVFGDGDVIPVWSSLEEALIGQNSGGASGNTGTTVEIDSQFLVVEHIVKILGGSKHPHRVLLLIKVIDWEVEHSRNSELLVEGGLLRPVVSELFDLSLGLQIHNSVNLVIKKLLDVKVGGWVWSNPEAGIIDLGHEEVLLKVGVGLLDEAIDDPALVGVLPDLHSLLLVGGWVEGDVVDLHGSSWGSLLLLISLLTELEQISIL